MAQPKVLQSFRTGNKGEAFLEYLMSDNYLLHRISGYKDVGLDFISELLAEDTPSRVLFGIQVKTSERSDLSFSSLGINEKQNDLEKYHIKPVVFDIKEKTVNYWKGFSIPLYLFLIVRSSKINNFDCYYKRLTPILHRTASTNSEEMKKKIRNEEFYKVNDGPRFISTNRLHSWEGGFNRDLFIDSIRCSYQNGSISHRSPKEFGLINWPEGKIYPDVLTEEGTEYKKRMLQALEQLESLELIEVSDNFEDRLLQILDGLKKRK